MPGMHSGLNITNSVLVTAFRSALMHQGLVALLLLFALATAWLMVREVLAARSGRLALPCAPEPAARRLLRVGFGVLWVFDGLLQAQPAMPAGLPSQVVAPAAATAPLWVRHLINWSGTAWSYHPVQAAAASVWIQVGLGIWLLASARGPWSRLAGGASAGWGVLVWVFGEVFGGLFAPGQTVLFGTPGAAACYCVAGVMVALPDRAWRSKATSRWLVTGLGVFFAGMAVLQAWPGRGFWPGLAPGRPGALTAMVASMASTSQPAPLAHLVGDFAGFTGGHGALVNAVAVVVVAGIGAGLLAARGRLLLAVVVVTAVFCLADWVLVEDLGFFGGLGTDPNSMVPLLLLVIGGYLAVSRPAPPEVPEPAEARAGPQARATWRERARPARLARGFGSASAAAVLALWAAVLVLIGAAPMALAQASPQADPIIAQALDGTSAPLDHPAPAFALTSVSGQPVSLESLRGKVLLLTFLDPVCTSDCPLIAQELRAADQLLGPQSGSVELVAVAANPLYYAPAYLAAFDRQENLTGVRNWLYLTGSIGQLRQVWGNYGISAVVLPSGQMIAHNDLVFVIDRTGHVRYEINADPGPGTAASVSSFAVEFAQAAGHVIAKTGSPSAS
jgi:cytochrome oxidase Cu insertion factor (SCO1/SenC/PrrC family)